jgi:hypothetical protein
VTFAATTLSVPSQRVFIVVFYFVIDSVRKLLDIPSYITRSIKVKENKKGGVRVVQIYLMEKYPVEMFHNL